MMPVTRVFRSGNSQAVRIPAELAYDDATLELSIYRQGDMLVMYPTHPSLRDMVDALRKMPKPPEVEQRQPIDVPERDGNVASI
jgi:antitoxin VapB